MQTAATTSQAALTASPLLSATIPNDTAPRRAIAVHNSFVCHAAELLKGTLMAFLLPVNEPALRLRFYVRLIIDPAHARTIEENGTSVNKARSGIVVEAFLPRLRPKQACPSNREVTVSVPRA